MQYNVLHMTFYILVQTSMEASVSAHFSVSLCARIYLWSRWESWKLSQANYCCSNFLNFVGILQLVAHVTKQSWWSRTDCADILLLISAAGLTCIRGVLSGRLPHCCTATEQWPTTAHPEWRQTTTRRREINLSEMISCCRCKTVETYSKSKSWGAVAHDGNSWKENQSTVNKTKQHLFSWSFSLTFTIILNAPHQRNTVALNTWGYPTCICVF